MQLLIAYLAFAIPASTGQAVTLVELDYWNSGLLFLISLGGILLGVVLSISVSYLFLGYNQRQNQFLGASGENS